MPPFTRPAMKPGQEQGFVIVAVLWLLAALAGLAMIFSVYLANSARALAVSDTALQSEALVSAAVELTAYRLQATGDDKSKNDKSKNNDKAADASPSRGAFHTRLNGADMSVSFISEAARIDLNKAPKELVAGLMSVLGASDEDAKEYAARIVAWRTKAAPDSAGNEDALYRAAGRAYSPRQAPFAHVNELSLVLGLPPALVARALPFVTVFSGLSGIDAMTARPEVIAAMPGMTPLTLKQFLEDRATFGNDRLAIAAALGAAKASATTEKSKAYRISIRVRLKNGSDTMSEVVINLRTDEGPYQVLSWRHDLTASRRGAEL